MSNFAKALKFKEVGRHYPVEMSNMELLFEASRGFPEDSELRNEIEYRLTVTLGTSALLNKNRTEEYKFDVVEFTKRQMKENMVERMFGEFRPHIYQIREALMMKDFYGAVSHLKRMEQVMFSIEDDA